MKGQTIRAEEDKAPARGGNVIDLMAALKRSIERPAESGGKAAPKKGASKPTARKPAAKKAPAKAAPARKRA
jgi:DNA end-binding protein Ku